MCNKFKSFHTSQHFTWLLALRWAAQLHCHWWHSVGKKRKRRNGEWEEGGDTLWSEVLLCADPPNQLFIRHSPRWNLTCKMASSVTFCWGEKEEKNSDQICKGKRKIWREMNWVESLLPLWSQSPHRNLPDSLPVEHFVSSGDARLFCSVRIEKLSKY